MAMLKNGNAMLELFEFESPAAAPGDARRPVNDHGLTQTCLDVTDLASESARLKDAGAEFLSEPVRMLPESGMPARFVCFKDPDGTVLERVEPGPAPNRS